MKRLFGASLRVRLLLGTLLGVSAALLVAGLVLSNLFREQVTRQFLAGLRVHLDQLTASVEAGTDGRPVLSAELVDARWYKPYSGLYWQVDGLRNGQMVPALLRSRSLWDATLRLPADTLVDGEVHVHDTTGPDGLRLRVLERVVHPDDQPAMSWRLSVAQDTRELDEAVSSFVGMLVLSLGVLAVALMAAAAAQVVVGLAPLRSLQSAVSALRAGRLQRLEGDFPAELQPLVDDFNGVLDQNTQIVLRARTQAGNLAHAIQTPLAVLANAAARPDTTPGELARLVDEQVAQARRQVNWHLSRARVAAAVGVPGVRTQVSAVVGPLVKVMERVHAGRHLDFDDRTAEAAQWFAGEEQDLQEMLGNLLDNACKWARSAVRIDVSAVEGAPRPCLQVTVEDDGPGIAEALREKVLVRGARVDEQMPGSGLGLAIVHDLAQWQGGSLRLETSGALGGLCVRLVLPAV
ncbi:sensor histidine kinase [Sphaerotilus sp.]|uniref:sensor histidine kinase n=1 Tax=Sphaerotilus sp. TaxID=2093942 RepID=UPI0034E19699